IQRLLLGLVMLAAVAPAQRRVEPRNMYQRILCAVPYVGQGTAEDPIRPKFAPIAGPSETKGILGYTQIASDDLKWAIVEFVARDASAFDEILKDKQVRVFVKGKHSRNEIETEMRRYKRGFNLDQFEVVIP